MAETNATRLAKLEVEMEQVIKNQQRFETICTDINTKLDSLVALKYKGAGAFWLASALIGTGIVGFLHNALDYFRGG